MNTLFFDVSTHVMYIGYAIDDEIIDFSIRLAKRDHAKYIVDRIQQLLNRNGATLQVLDRIIVGCGPGSYTGLRIAGTVAKTLAYATGIQLYKVSSLVFMTSGYKGLVCAMQDARRGNVFSNIYEGVKVLFDDALRTFETFREEPEYKKAACIFIDENTYKVDIQTINKHAIRVENIHDYEPNYARITEAEQRAIHSSK